MKNTKKSLLSAAVVAFMCLIILMLQRIFASNPEDFVIENGTLIEYKGNGGKVVIPDGVKKIGEEAFIGYETITEFVIPEGVIEIEDYALFC